MQLEKRGRRGPGPQSIYSRMLVLLEGRYPNFANVWHSARAQFGDDWETEFSEEMARMFGSGESAWDEAIDGYAEFCTDALKEQIYFERHHRYRARDYREVSQACYHNADFMQRRYLPGMYLSHFIWPHHHRMLRYFRRAAMGLRDRPSTFYEVGTGCGVYSKETLRLLPESQGVGFDISEYALAFTDRVVSAFGMAARYSVRRQDVLADPPTGPADLVISQEVLEHLEDPQAFLCGLAAMTRPGGYAYIAAAVNAGHVDHIYLYRSPEEIAEQIRVAGLTILDQTSEYAYDTKPIDIRPCQAGFLCRKEE